MSKAEMLDAKSEEAEQKAVKFPRLRTQYLSIAETWRRMARQYSVYRAAQ
jgi:hypothetical protein